MKEIKLDSFIENEENREIVIKVKDKQYSFITSAWKALKVKQIINDKSKEDLKKIEDVIALAFTEKETSEVLMLSSRVIEECALVIVASLLGFEPNKLKNVMGSDKGKQLAKEMGTLMTSFMKSEN